MRSSPSGKMVVASDGPRRERRFSNTVIHFDDAGARVVLKGESESNEWGGENAKRIKVRMSVRDAAIDLHLASRSGTVFIGCVVRSGDAKFEGSEDGASP